MPPVSLTVRDVMQRHVFSVGPRMPLAELDQAFVEKRVGGFPVVEDEQLLGVVSRSDVVRRLGFEQHLAANTSDFYWDHEGFHEAPRESLRDIATRIGEQLEELCVQDLMTRQIVVADADESLGVAAQKLLDGHIHRVPVVTQGRLVGILSTLDLVRLFADGRVQVIR